MLDCLGMGHGCLTDGEGSTCSHWREGPSTKPPSSKAIIRGNILLLPRQLMGPAVREGHGGYIRPWPVCGDNPCEQGRGLLAIGEDAVDAGAPRAPSHQAARARGSCDCGAATRTIALGLCACKWVAHLAWRAYARVREFQECAQCIWGASSSECAQWILPAYAPITMPN